MQHPFDGIMATENSVPDEAQSPEPSRRSLLRWILAGGAAVMGLRFWQSAQAATVKPTTARLGEEGGRATTMMVGEEGGRATTMIVGEEGGKPTTLIIGEEGGKPTSLIVGEEGGTTPPMPPTTTTQGEEGGTVTSNVVGEEGGTTPSRRPRRRRTRARKVERLRR